MPALDIVAVTTATGYAASSSDEIKMIVNAVKSDAPLPSNAGAQSLLARRIQEAAATEPSSPVGPAPEIAKAISGKTYRFAQNPLGLTTMTLNLEGPDPSYAYELATGRADAPVERVEGPLGLDGTYRTGKETNQGPSVAKAPGVTTSPSSYSSDTLATTTCRRRFSPSKAKASIWSWFRETVPAPHFMAKPLNDFDGFRGLRRPGHSSH